MAAPVVAEGLVFQSIKNEDALFGNGLAACDARDGTLRWRHSTDSAIKRAPAYCGGRLFLVTTIGLVQGLIAENGEQTMELRIGRCVSTLGVYHPVSNVGSCVHRCKFALRGIGSGKRGRRLASR